jgi:hypothetical protein
LGLVGKIGKLVVTIEVNLEAFVAGLEQLLFGIRNGLRGQDVLTGENPV